MTGGLITLLLALQPFGGTPDQRSPWKRLLRFPGTYLAAAFLVYLIIGAVNPNYEVVREGSRWWIKRVLEPLPLWLPNSIDARHETMNAWWIIQYHLGAFALALGLYGGLTRRSSVTFVLWTLLINMCAMSVVGVIQRVTGADLILFFYESPNRQFWGSFHYRNQGAAYLNWGIVIAAVLFFYYANRTWREGRSGGPHFLAFCLIGVLATSVGMALSRGGILFASVLTASFLILALLSYLRNAFRMPFTTFIPMSALFALLLSAGIYQVYYTIDWEAIQKRFGNVGLTIENADSDARYLATQATWDMAQDNLWTGWGAGSFRYGFPKYQKRIPELFHTRYREKHGWLGQKIFHFAHNDILQFIAEYGVIGASILLLCALAFLIPPLLTHATLTGLFLWIGFVGAMGHAFLDFIFHSPAYWSAFIAGIALISRLLQLDAREA